MSFFVMCNAIEHYRFLLIDGAAEGACVDSGADGGGGGKAQSPAV